jgi:hypothetical protein
VRSFIGLSSRGGVWGGVSTSLGRSGARRQDGGRPVFGCCLMILSLLAMAGGVYLVATFILEMIRA